MLTLCEQLLSGLARSDSKLVAYLHYCYSGSSEDLITWGGLDFKLWTRLSILNTSELKNRLFFRNRVQLYFIFSSRKFSNPMLDAHVQEK